MKFRKSFAVQLAAALVAVLFLSVVLLGTVSAVLPAFGYLPILGMTSLSFAPWLQVWETPGLTEMLWLSFFSGMSSTLVSMLLALAFVSAAWDRRFWYQAQRWLSPIMATPHVALSVGLFFLIMPSGILARGLSAFMDWQGPPDWQTVQDPWALSLTALLVLKETPFLILMLMVAIRQLPVREILRTGAGLGYQSWTVWVKLIWPQLYLRVRLSMLTVLVFALSVVDIAIVLGPATPPTFAVQVLNWYQNPDLEFQALASVGSVLLMILVLAAIGSIVLLERLAATLLRGWLTSGRRGSGEGVWRCLSIFGWKALLVVFGASAFMLLIWSFVWRWRFPHLLPQSWSFRHWERAWPRLVEPLEMALLIGVVSAFLALLISVLILEAGRRSQIASPYLKKMHRLISRTMYLPLLLPQLTFLFGIQIWLIRSGAEGHWWSVVFMHLLFVLPYCYLSLSGPWRYYDERQTAQALMLSGSSVRAFLQVKCLILLKPLLASFALGFAVSIAQYLPTLFAGAGRISTVTTETVALASGGNRKVMAVYALVQILLPVLMYGLMLLLSSRRIRNRRPVRRWV
ncbi:ABC transporter permease [Endozoicomonas sp. ISHI1]|uniref:ABC transporter permease n=1 Tax=Endozoicomonas sp. ISHI1 TaxID=2825882 RepID=UPI00214862CE|nr:ABC transporter permease [Endozoicomonas sp. ISHI1]